MFRSILMAGLATLFTLTTAFAEEQPIQPQPEPPAISPNAVTLAGVVTPLTRALAQRGIEHDKDVDVSDSTLTLSGNDGKLFLIIKNEGSRALFKDAELLGRQIQLVGVQVEGTQLLKVERIRTIVDGKLMEVDYWCEKCALRYSEPGICICCGMDALRRELPVKDDKKTSTPNNK